MLDNSAELGDQVCSFRCPILTLTLFLQKPCASQKLRELVITGLAHLVMANSESGFKQCLPLAYDPDHRKRTIFAYVFARVIGQGTVFDPVDKPLTKTRHTSLCEVSFKIHRHTSAPF